MKGIGGVYKSLLGPYMDDVRKMSKSSNAGAANMAQLLCDYWDNKDLTSLSAAIAKADERMDHVEHKVDENEQRIAETEKKVELTDQKVNNLQKEMSELRTYVDASKCVFSVIPIFIL